jgi:hypothetical protein
MDVLSSSKTIQAVLVVLKLFNVTRDIRKEASSFKKVNVNVKYISTVT